MEQKKPLVILTGPTAVGKTALSISLAKRIDGEIISADSVQVYRGMDIGSAKITTEEMQGVRHHLIDILPPEEAFNITLFQKYAKEAMQDIYARGAVPIIVGGTGFYIQSVLYDIDFTETESSNAYRDSLEQIALEKGPQILHEMLEKVDPKSAAIIHANNVKRTIRALEFYHFTGNPISAHNESEHEKDAAYRFCYFVLNDRRETIYENIEKRVDLMLEQGLVEEVSKLKEQGCTNTLVSMQALGYKEILDYLNKDITLDEAIYRIKRDTRHFAKRQLTWFRREKDVIWIPKNEFDYDTEKMLAYMLQKLEEKKVLSQ